MAKELPYLSSYKNVGTLFERIHKAKVPDAFTVRHLSDTIGLKSTNDRQLITLLKKMGFLDPNGKPTEEYGKLKNTNTVKTAIAEGIRRAYSPLYEANENAHALPSDELKGLVAQVSGTEEGVTNLITWTYNALVKLADFETPTPAQSNGTDNEPKAAPEKPVAGTQLAPLPKFAPEFRFSVEVHLPSNGTEETYLNIFNALRKALA